MRLDELLRNELPRALKKEISNSKIRRLIISGNVFLGTSQIRAPGVTVGPNSKISVRVDEEKLFFEKAVDDIHYDVTKKDVLFEDDAIIMVNKPPFFPTEAGMVGSRDNLHAAVIRYLHGKNPGLKNPPYAGVMHRLDRETSGVILFTKARAANKGCHEMFENHTAQKIYLALASNIGGARLKDEFSVSMKMGRVSGKTRAAKWGEVKDGLDSKTEFRILEKFKKNGREYILLECKPLTGRTHQIRAHLSSLALPIVGDELYGGEKFSRTLLHADSLSFFHPISGEKLKIESPRGKNDYFFSDLQLFFNINIMNLLE